MGFTDSTILCGPIKMGAVILLHLKGFINKVCLFNCKPHHTCTAACRAELLGKSWPAKSSPPLLFIMLSFNVEGEGSSNSC